MAIFYDQILTGNTNSLLMFVGSRKTITKDFHKYPIEEAIKAKHKKQIDDINKRVDQYTYKI